jgi:SAM-dependent methyltransferase
MRADWNARAEEDANYYVAFGARNQDEEAFLATAWDVIGAIEWELKRFPPGANRRAWRALEIGCGPGRLMKTLSRDFGEIHGVDVSDAMIRLARERLRGIPHAHVHATDGASLAQFADESFDIVYSYAVFQHIPSREVVLEYMRETCRVLKPGGIFRGQFSGLPPNENPNTWHGVCFSADEIRRFTRENGLLLLALEGIGTQYMWTTWRKRGGAPTGPVAPAQIRRITNASSSEPVVPNRGPLAAISIWVVNLPSDSGLSTLEARVDGASGTTVYIGPPEAGGLQQVNVMLPNKVRTGLVPVELFSNSAALGAPVYVRVIPGGPLVPRIISLTDGINLVEENRCSTGTIKLQIDELSHPKQVAVELGGHPVRNFEIGCVDPLPPRYEANFRLPEGIRPGPNELRIRIGRRSLIREIEVSFGSKDDTSPGTGG